MRGASHHLAFMSSCLTISHACLPCVPGRGVSPCVPGVIEGGEDACGAINVGCKLLVYGICNLKFIIKKVEKVGG